MHVNLFQKSNPLQEAPQKEEENPNSGKAVIPDNQTRAIKKTLQRQRSDVKQAGHLHHHHKKKNLKV